MLQCCDCLQWFHQECIRSLSYQLMCGDRLETLIQYPSLTLQIILIGRFFKFTCTLCNGKEEESIQRLEMGMVDALHLVIFNLIISKNQKYAPILILFSKKKN